MNQSKRYKKYSFPCLLYKPSGYFSPQNTLKRHHVINFRPDADPLAN
jgi:hypothetical protein